MGLLTGFRAAQLGRGIAAAVCGRLLADVGAEVVCIDPDSSVPLARYLNYGKRIVAADATASALNPVDLIICEGQPRDLRARQHDPDTLRRHSPDATLVYISPYGLTGPSADDPATDLTLFFASGIARLLTGQVVDLDEPPMRPVGEQYRLYRRVGRGLRRHACRPPWVTRRN